MSDGAEAVIGPLRQVHVRDMHFRGRVDRVIVTCASALISVSLRDTYPDAFCLQRSRSMLRNYHRWA
eukprot:scaffold56674_cov66-Phaeocystis_antarctica.AAC.3